MIYINRDAKEPNYVQLYRALKQEIENGEYAQSRLTPIRVLADELKISKSTVVQVYQQLAA